MKKPESVLRPRGSSGFYQFLTKGLALLVTLSFTRWQRILALTTVNKDDVVNEQAVVQMLLDSISSYNWGKYEIVKFDLINGEIIFNIIGNPILEMCSAKDSPQCFFTKGAIAGIITEVTGIDFNPSAMTCKDDTNVCQIVFNKK